MIGNNQMGTWELMDDNRHPAIKGDKFFVDGEPYILTGGRPPHHHGSTGRVYMESINNPKITPEWFPTVIRCTWVLTGSNEEE